MDTAFELRLTGPGYGTVVENFVTTNPTAAFDKRNEWEKDSFNRGMHIITYHWVNGVRAEVDTRIVY